MNHPPSFDVDPMLLGAKPAEVSGRRTERRLAEEEGLALRFVGFASVQTFGSNRGWFRFASRRPPLAEGEGFEPPEAFTSAVFKTAAIDHSATLPEQMREPGLRLFYKL